MKRIFVAVLVLGLAFGAMTTAEAGKKKKKKPPVPVRIERVVEVTYDHPGIGVATPIGGTGYPTSFPDPSEIPTGPDDLYFKIEVTDASGQKVSGFISQGDLDGNGVNDDGYGSFCGAHAEAIPLVEPGTPILGIYAHSGVCADGTASIMTSGTIKVTFSNMP